MQRRIFAITNREELRGERSVLSLAHRIGAALGIGNSVELVTRIERVDHDRDWLVFKGDSGNGFAVYLEIDGVYSSPLQIALQLVRTAKSLVGALGGTSNIPWRFSLERLLPNAWTSWRVVGIAGEVVCAIPTTVEGEAANSMVKRDRRVVNIRLVLVVDAPFVSPVRALKKRSAPTPGIVKGTEFNFNRCEAWIPDLGLWGEIFVKQEGVTMEINLEDVEQQRVPGVRIDLGELEVRLVDLVGLRPGTVINLGAVSVERCFVRVGATELAQGRIESRDGELCLAIERVLL